MTDSSPTIAVIGGSGLYSFFESDDAAAAPEQRTVATPYGSVSVSIGRVGGRAVAFLPRHGGGHSVAPHLIGYRANIWALRSLGVRAIVSTAAVGGLHESYPPGSFALPDQFLDRTWGREQTFYDEDSVQHLSLAEPFCPQLRAIALEAAEVPLIPTATVAVIQGPRFSTRAESASLLASGAHLVNMTLSPEVPLAAELGIGTVTLAYVTDSDAAPAEERLSAELVFRRLAEAQPRIIASLTRIVEAIPDDYVRDDLLSTEAVDAVLARVPR
jgi:5'-methylthioadenosine phosphorylase